MVSIMVKRPWSEMHSLSGSGSDTVTVLSEQQPSQRWFRIAPEFLPEPGVVICRRDSSLYRRASSCMVTLIDRLSFPFSATALSYSTANGGNGWNGIGSGVCSLPKVANP